MWPSWSDVGGVLSYKQKKDWKMLSVQLSEGLHAVICVL